MNLFLIFEIVVKSYAPPHLDVGRLNFPIIVAWGESLRGVHFLDGGYFTPEILVGVKEYAGRSCNLRSQFNLSNHGLRSSRLLTHRWTPSG